MTSDPTWGDFTELAFLRLQYALAALAEAATRSTPGQHAARTEALAGTCRLLHNYSRRFGPLAHDPLGIAEGDVARLQGNLETLGRVLRFEARYARPEPDPVARHLADATRMLALGSDLLNSHHGPDGQHRSPYAAYLDSPTVARHVIAEVSELASTAGRVAARLGLLCPPDPRETRGHPLERRLAEPATLIEQAAIGIHRQLRSPRPVTPAPGLPNLPTAVISPPSPVRPGEPQYEALAAVTAGTEWLGAHTVRQATLRVPDVTFTELSLTANHTALAHLFAARLVEHTHRQLTADSAGQDALMSAAGSLRAAAQAWQRVAVGWGSYFRSASTSRDSRPAQEAEFAVVRLGRTLFSAGWTHRDSGRRPTRAPQDIIAAPADVPPILAAVHAVPAAGQVLAEHTPWLAQTMIGRGVLLSSDPEHNPHGSTPADQFKKGWTRWYPASPDQIVPVTVAYDEARKASAAAQSATASAAAAAGHPLARALLDADRRRTLGFTGSPDRDRQRVNAAAARARSATASPSRNQEPPGLPRHRAAELSREVAAHHRRRNAR
ncbi:hypothetical protein [Streptomyces rubellomurinus]|uniref:Uncharacterized protein n=1 Tax=Streptomyces rubellomurinus (strain ATCC 31215) TaxID=359131 RepID=A0A0F2THH9_STRR3|nr:hypothetical protein [Streptomyces rubellomurinus]KJS61956.1 hypothetical protein VM95_11385 [Streptomyces rubellomurinus]